MHGANWPTFEHKPIWLLENINIARPLVMVIVQYRFDLRTAVLFFQVMTRYGTTDPGHFRYSIRDCLCNCTVIQPSLVYGGTIQVEVGAKEVFDQILTTIEI